MKLILYPASTLWCMLHTDWTEGRKLKARPHEHPESQSITTSRVWESAGGALRIDWRWSGGEEHRMPSCHSILHLSNTACKCCRTVLQNLIFSLTSWLFYYVGLGSLRWDSDEAQIFQSLFLHLEGLQCDYIEPILSSSPVWHTHLQVFEVRNKKYPNEHFFQRKYTVPNSKGKHDMRAKQIRFKTPQMCFKHDLTCLTKGLFWSLHADAAVCAFTPITLRSCEDMSPASVMVILSLLMFADFSLLKHFPKNLLQF